MKRLAVVISQGQSQHPAKRQLEEDVVGQLIGLPGIDVTVVPHLYDLKVDSTGMLALQGVSGDMILLAWLYPRAAFWTLDRQGVQGQFGKTLLPATDDDLDAEEESLDDSADSRQASTPSVASQRAREGRKIYCLDLAAGHSAAAIVDEIQRIRREATTQVVDLASWIQGAPSAAAQQRYEQPTNNTALGQRPAAAAALDKAAALDTTLTRVEEAGDRRWYPVIDFSRCTNCMECIDFCLFGVYGVDVAETILVEQPDNCRKGCPACSRVCPENAIIFPQHKTPAIAGAQVALASLKIDLSKLFGAPDSGEDARQVADRERDEQLRLAGRETVGAEGSRRVAPNNAPQRQPVITRDATAPRDELDSLLDQLDDLDV